MSKSMETNTTAIYRRKSTEDDGKSVGQQELSDTLEPIFQTSILGFCHEFIADLT